jgi:Ca2+-binding RTX toxin-like protein
MLSLLDDGNDSYANTSLPTFDSVAPEGGDDTVQTGPRRDEMGADAGNDTFDSGEGDDSIINGPGADLMNGGPGVDATDYFDSNAGVNVTLDDQANDGEPGEGDNAAQIEQVAGTRFDDSLTGNGVANELEGDEGDDQLTGLGGNDELFGDEGDDILNPGASPDGSRDFVFCGSGFDVALADPLDAVDPSCERRGVRITGESANVKRKGKARVLVACPLDARDPCAGTLVLFSDGKQITKTGSFDLPAGGTGNARVKLTGKGRKALRQAGGKLLVTAQAQTAETGGVATTEAQILLTGKTKK